MKKYLLFLVVILFSVPSQAQGFGRDHPIYNVDKAMVMTNNDAGTTQSAVGQAIVKALTLKTWHVTTQDKEAGVLQAEILVRDRHYALVEITYTATNFSIMYKDSRVLRYKGTTIHRNYNKWVKLLEEQIRNELLLL